MTDKSIKPVRKFNLKNTREQEAVRILQEGNDLIASLDERNAPERRKYPEQEFRKNFLPIVTGEAYDRLPPGYGAERLREEANSFWLKIAGGPGHEVEVVESDGTVAFIMPALMDTSVINTFQPKNEAGLKQLNSDYQSKVIGMPAIASRMIERGLSHKLGQLLSSEPDRAEAAKKIDVMRKYYNLEDPEAKKEKEQAKTNFMGDMEFD